MASRALGAMISCPSTRLKTVETSPNLHRKKKTVSVDEKDGFRRGALAVAQRFLGEDIGG